MRAAVYDAYTENFDDITVRDLPDPKLPPASVLIEVKAAGVNPVDWKLVGGHLDAFMPVQFPVTPGWDVAGVVIGLGFDTPEFSIGDEVIAYARKDVLSTGTFAEKVAVPVRAVAAKPKSLSWEQAGGLPLAGGTALRTLESLGALDGRTVLVHGASGGVGSFAVQIAAWAGARVIGTASERNHDYLRGLGAEPVTYGRVWPIACSRPPADPSTVSPTSSGASSTTLWPCWPRAARMPPSPTPRSPNTVDATSGCAPTEPRRPAWDSSPMKDN
jgi:NADPH:quinone reductase-like Zn-dependent oxidoreductase